MTLPNKQTITILGCGWLGLPLAKALIAEGHIVKGSTTTEAKLNVLKAAGVAPFWISLSEEGVKGNITGFLESADVLIIDVPPKVKVGESYPKKIQNLIQHIKAAGIEKVLFVSSTSVYADDNTIVTEDTVPNPDSESGTQLLEAEQLLKAALPNTTILRFAGLIGEDRHPVYHLAGRENIANPDAPVNLIHREDCIGIIKAIIAKGAWGETFNAVAPEHPSRKEYYTAKAKELGLEAPGFEEGKESVGKEIASGKIYSVLNYIINQL
jgi:nucleoside-diphosphate-sugar epimerase